MQSNDELRVIRDVLNGNTAAFRFIVKRYEGPIIRFVHTFVLDVHESEDIAQEVFLAAYTQLSSYVSTHASFSTWLFTIARNRCLNRLRQKRPTPVDTRIERINVHTPMMEAAENEFFARLDGALADLPLNQRTAFVLFEFEGRTYEEISQIEETPLGTVKSRINRAKQALRSILETIRTA